MKIQTIRDSQGNPVGIARTDSQGNVIDSRTPMTPEQRRAPMPEQGALPILPDVETEEEKLAKQQEEQTLAEKIAQSDIQDAQFSNDGGQPTDTNESSQRPPAASEFQGPGFDSNFTANFQANRKEAEQAVREGNFAQRTLGRATLGSMAIAQGAADGVQDLTDFAASVGDFLTRREVNDSDNLINFRREGTKPSSVDGNLASEATSFVTSSANLSVLPGTRWDFYCR